MKQAEWYKYQLAQILKTIVKYMQWCEFYVYDSTGEQHSSTRFFIIS